MYMGFFVFLSGGLSLLLVRKHFLLSLLSLEFLMLSIYYTMYFYFCFFVFDYYFIIVYLVLGVCEGVLGLSLIVYLVRKDSLDYLDSISLT
uniref:NADH dehydrogenase subunit 4L n=1 Tax=Flata truncata TaxID=3081121 RepID=UPI002A810EB5|nr:NADH dehydrogenase subunit 4L [Flata truncata]WOW99057.1 NADH dehydrogenase subunit 4L [Flata truncata]